MRLLSVLAALVIVFVSCAIDVDTAHCQIRTTNEVDAYFEARTPVPEPTPGGTPSPVRAGYDETQWQVLATTQTIPAGTTVRELIEAPTVYLTAVAVPGQFGCETTINTVGQLVDLDGYVTSTDIGTSRFLDARQFVPGS